jgi:hypothetical protein
MLLGQLNKLGLDALALKFRQDGLEQDGGVPASGPVGLPFDRVADRVITRSSPWVNTSAERTARNVLVSAP